MKPHEQGALNKIGKTFAKPLSFLVANPIMGDLARLLEAYWCILLGKGSGSSWAIDAEVKAVTSVINTSSPTVLDVGAKTGEWALLINQYFPQARIFLFEPQPSCQKIIIEKKIPNTTLIPNAVSSVKHSTKLNVQEDKPGNASLHHRRDSYFQGHDFTVLDVDTVTIDEIVAIYNLTHVDFMKMDIEGHELEALKGSVKSLESGVIKALSFEFGSGNINSRTFFHDFWDLLHPLGYQIYRILPSSRLMPIKEYYEDCEYFRGVSNYIAVLKQ